jgi:hypothetical protein
MLTIVTTTNNTATIYFGTERTNGVNVTACYDGSLESSGCIDWTDIPDGGAEIWNFVRSNGGEMTTLTTSAMLKIIHEEGMGVNGLGCVECLHIDDNGFLRDDSVSEKAANTPEAFRKQVQDWKEAIGL